MASPTGSGKTLTAFLAAIDALVRESVAQGGQLTDANSVVYVSLLQALSNDIHINREAPRWPPAIVSHASAGIA